MKPKLGWTWPSHGFIKMELMQIFNVHFVSIVVALIVLGISAGYIYLKRSRGCLDPKRFKEFKLIKKTRLSHNTFRFTFALPTPTSILGLPVGKHVLCRGIDAEGKEVIRPYTPITLDTHKGYFELVVKVYPQGRMSRYLGEMSVGDYLPVQGPVGNFSYKPGQVRAFGMIAGGSGITPMFQLIRAVLENPKDKTNLHLIYANTTEEDILLKEELDLFANKFPNRFKVYYVLSQPPQGWKGGIGHVNMEMIKLHCPAPSPDIQILLCGPPAMHEAMKAHLNSLGYTPEMLFEYS